MNNLGANAPRREVLAPDLVFTAAVTGHRDIGETRSGSIEESIRSVLLDAASQLSKSVQDSDLDHDREIGLRFLTALAEGADQIGGKAATEDAVTELGWKLSVALPFESSKYNQRLNENEHRKRFRELLDQTSDLIEIKEAGGSTDSDWSHYWDARRFATLGHLIVRRADLLVAVWRGKPPAGVGGTADVVRLALQNGVPVVWINPDDGAVRTLLPDPVARTTPLLELSAEARCMEPSGHAGAIAAAVGNVMLGSEASRESATHKYLAERERVVPEWRSRQGLFHGTAAASYSMLQWLILIGTPGNRWPFRVAWRTRPNWPFASPFVQSVSYDIEPDPAAPPDEIKLNDEAQRADTYATYLGFRYRSAYVSIFLLASVAVALALAFILSPENKPLFVAAELIVLAIAVFLSVRTSSRRQGLHRKWLDARSIVESLRGEVILSWIGFSGRRVIPSFVNSDGDTKDDSLRDRPSAWAAHYVNALAALPTLPSTGFDRPEIASVARKIDAVLSDQLAYHKRNYSRLHLMHHRLDVIGLSFIALAAAASLAFLSAFSAKNMWTEGWLADGALVAYPPLAKASAFLGGVLPALAAALTGIRYHGDFERFSQRSKLTAQVLAGLRERAESLIAKVESSTAESAAPLFEELVDLALETKATFDDDLDDWRFAYQSREIPLP